MRKIFIPKWGMRVECVWVQSEECRDVYRRMNFLIDVKSFLKGISDLMDYCYSLTF